MLSGPASAMSLMACGRAESKVTKALLAAGADNGDLSRAVERFWTIDSAGVNESGDEPSDSVPNVTFRDGRYDALEVKPWSSG